MVNEPEIQAFLARVHRELEEIKEQMAVFQNRKRELEEMVRKCEAMFGGDQPRKDVPVSPTGQRSFPSPPAAPRHPKKRRYRRIQRAKPLWQLIKDLLREVGRDMSFQEIEQESQARGWSDKHKTKILLRAMQDKEGKVFVKTNKGTWDLKERVEHREQ
jgi:hypothetical protein